MHRGLEQIMILNYRSWGLIAIDRCKISPRCRRSIGTAKPVKSSYWIDIRHANVSLYTCSTSNYSHSTLILWLACDRHSNDTTLHQPFDHFFFSFFCHTFQFASRAAFGGACTKLPKKQFDVHLSTPWNYALETYRHELPPELFQAEKVWQ